MRIDHGSTSRGNGFGLLEVLISLALLSILAAGVLQSTALLSSHYKLVDAHRRQVIEKWNTGRRIRFERSPSSSLIEPVAGARPLYRHRLENDRGLVWEVWVGEF